MDTEELIGYWVMSALSVVLGIIGIVLAVGAVDNAILSFGLSLAAFAVLFVYFAIDRTHSPHTQSSGEK